MSLIQQLIATFTQKYQHFWIQLHMKWICLQIYSATSEKMLVWEKIRKLFLNRWTVVLHILKSTEVFSTDLSKSWTAQWLTEVYKQQNEVPQCICMLSCYICLLVFTQIFRFFTLKKIMSIHRWSPLLMDWVGTRIERQPERLSLSFLNFSLDPNGPLYACMYVKQFSLPAKFATVDLVEDILDYVVFLQLDRLLCIILLIC